MYTVATAQLPEPPAGADRIFIAPNAVIVLDGASSFAPEAPNPAAYVDALGEHLQKALDADPAADLSDALAAAIEATAYGLDIRPGQSPSSTVAVARWNETTVDLLVLGDTQISTPHGFLRDDRLANLATDERAVYRSRLLEGHGYDGRHRELLADLQTEEARHRNQPGGYWIAEADPSAAAHALTQSHPTSSTPWLVLATDGAYKPLWHLGIKIGPDATSGELAVALHRCDRWESAEDPHGQNLPRAKQRDDKAIVLLRRST